MNLGFRGELEGLAAGIGILGSELSFGLADDGLPVKVEQTREDIVEAVFDGREGIIRYSRKIHFFRALGLFVEALGSGKNFKITEKPIYSLYGSSKKPSPGILRDIDILVMDIQDIGSRYYTFIYTMAYSMESCAENGKTFVILDRINPIGGTEVEGNILNPDFKSFVGLFPITARYGYFRRQGHYKAF